MSSILNRVYHNYSQRPASGLFVIDVSSYQGNIEWSKLKGVIDAAIIRVGFVDTFFGGGFDKVDLKFTDNQKLARENGIPIGYYYYAFGDESPTREALRFTQAIGKHFSDEPVWLDIEAHEPAFTKAWVRDFLKIVEYQLQQPCHIYTDYIFAIENPWIYELIENTDRTLWISYIGRSWEKALQHMHVGKIYMRQYSRRGKLGGISTGVDLNHWYGSKETWDNLTRTLPRKQSDEKLGSIVANTLQWPTSQHALYIKHDESGATYSENADTVFETSSVIKIAVILATLNTIKDSGYSLNTKLNITDEMLSQGSGIITWLKMRRLRIFKLITLIAKYSDCTATNCLIQFCGGKNAINRLLKEKNLKTRLDMEQLQFSNKEQVMPHVGHTTAREMTELTHELLVSGVNARSMRHAFRKIHLPWFDYYINTKMLSTQKLYIKSGSMKRIGNTNDCVLNCTGVIKDRSGTYSFTSLNRVQLGIHVKDIDLTRVEEEIGYYLVYHFRQLRANVVS